MKNDEGEVCRRSMLDAQKKIEAMRRDNPAAAGFAKAVADFFTAARMMLLVIERQNARIAELERELAAARGERPH